MIEGAYWVPFFYGNFSQSFPSYLHIYAYCLPCTFPMLDFRLAPFYFAELPKF